MSLVAGGSGCRDLLLPLVVVGAGVQAGIGVSGGASIGGAVGAGVSVGGGALVGAGISGGGFGGGTAGKTLITADVGTGVGGKPAATQP